MNRPLYALFGLIIIAGVGYIELLPYLNDNDTLKGAVLGIIGAMIGAAVGGVFSGWYSYQAGIRGARENFELMKKYDGYQKLIQIISTLKYTHLTMKLFLEAQDNAKARCEFLLYDHSWFYGISYLKEAYNLTDGEVNIIQGWFNLMEDFTQQAKNRILLAIELKQIFEQESPAKLINEVGKLIEKISEKKA